MRLYLPQHYYNTRGTQSMKHEPTSSRNFIAQFATLFPRNLHIHFHISLTSMIAKDKSTMHSSALRYCVGTFFRMTVQHPPRWQLNIRFCSNILFIASQTSLIPNLIVPCIAVLSTEFAFLLLFGAYEARIHPTI